MKQLKRSGIYKAANVTFNPETKDAYSYSWWRFVAIVEGKLIFNNFRYSNTTAKHQHKVRSLLNALGIKVDIEMPLPRGIRFDQSLAELITESEEYLCDQIGKEELKRQDRNEKARQRSAAKIAKLDAEFKLNADKITHQDVINFRLSKGTAEAVQGE